MAYGYFRLSGGHTVRQGPDSQCRPQLVLMLTSDRQQWKHQQRLHSPMIPGVPAFHCYLDEISFATSNFSPRFHKINVIAASLRAIESKAISGRIPLATFI